ncbi:oxidoreductase [Amylibacter ulvae]|uniref:2-oxoglutarate-dependent ethylene/succinate-forming enzyme n=1 Tax=Paramylibacter ulvae TaxID=1651968 RepID=A0ABQ3CX71_9RHOB|nr:isopenicillin N synthase family oxygenase [Amylibacter ulvae]GHA44803.1 oxidoreductase [Amylibacter ulvae]
MSEFDVLAISPKDADAPAKFAKSLRETGFAILKDHDMTPAEIDKMYDAWAGWFATDERFDFAVKPGTSDGYFGMKSENAKGATHKDLKEFFHVYQNKEVPKSVEPVTRDFNEKLIKIGHMLLEWLDQETPQDVKDIMSEPMVNMVKGSDSNLLRILHYPPLPDDVEPGETRAAAHEDINLITLLVTGSEPGLQAQDVNGTWHDVPCQAGYITINSGDMLSQASKGYYPSTPHRVINPEKQENRSRYSMPLFMHPRPDVVLDHQTAGEFLDQRLKEIGLK